MLIVEDSTAAVKCRTAIKSLFLYFNLCLSVKMDCLSHLYPYPFLLKQNINLVSNTILLTNLLEPVITFGSENHII